MNGPRPKDEYDLRWAAIKRRRRHAINSLLEDLRDFLVSRVEQGDWAAFEEARNDGYLPEVPASTVSTDVADDIKALISRHVPELEPGHDVS